MEENERCLVLLGATVGVPPVTPFLLDRWVQLVLAHVQTPRFGAVARGVVGIR